MRTQSFLGLAFDSFGLGSRLCFWFRRGLWFHGLAFTTSLSRSNGGCGINHRGDLIGLFGKCAREALEETWLWCAFG